MSIVSCPSCSQRISSLADTCPHCGFSKTGVSIEPEVLQARQLRKLRYRARMLTYLGMLITLCGFLVWWFQQTGFNGLPGQVSQLLIGVGVVGYLAARVWLFMLSSRLKKL